MQILDVTASAAADGYGVLKSTASPIQTIWVFHKPAHGKLLIASRFQKIPQLLVHLINGLRIKCHPSCQKRTFFYIQWIDKHFFWLVCCRLPSGI